LIPFHVVHDLCNISCSFEITSVVLDHQIPAQKDVVGIDGASGGGSSNANSHWPDIPSAQTMADNSFVVIDAYLPFAIPSFFFFVVAEPVRRPTATAESLIGVDQTLASPRASALPFRNICPIIFNTNSYFVSGQLCTDRARHGMCLDLSFSSISRPVCSSSSPRLDNSIIRLFTDVESYL